MAEPVASGGDTLRRKMETDYSQSDIQTTNRYPGEIFVLLMFGKRSTDFLAALIEEGAS